MSENKTRKKISRKNFTEEQKKDLKNLYQRRYIDKYPEAVRIYNAESKRKWRANNPSPMIQCECGSLLLATSYVPHLTRAIHIRNLIKLKEQKKINNLSE